MTDDATYRNMKQERDLALADAEPCNEDLALDIEGIDVRYQGDPSYEHDGYYIRNAAAKLVRTGYPLYTSPQAAQTDEREAFEAWWDSGYTGCSNSGPWTHNTPIQWAWDAWRAGRKG